MKQLLTSGSCGLSTALSITQIVIAEDESVARVSFSDSLIDRSRNAEDPKIEMEIDAIKIKNIAAKLAPENAASTVPIVVRSSTNVVTCSNQNESDALQAASDKVAGKLSSLLSNTGDKKSICYLISDMMHEQLLQWKASLEIWDENKLLGTKYKTYIPLKVGSKSADHHSMKETNLNYAGEENFHRKPHGQGKVIFENGDWMCGEFRDGLRQGQGTVKTGVELAR